MSKKDTKKQDLAPLIFMNECGQVLSKIGGGLTDALKDIENEQTKFSIRQALIKVREAQLWLSQGLSEFDDDVLLQVTDERHVKVGSNDVFISDELLNQIKSKGSA